MPLSALENASKLPPGSTAVAAPPAAFAPTKRCAWHKTEQCVFEAPLAHATRTRRNSRGEASPIAEPVWSASYVWATDKGRSTQFLLRAGPPRVWGQSFFLRHALDEKGEKKALLTSTVSYCAHKVCSHNALYPILAAEAARACESPVRPQYVGLDEQGRKVWITKLFDADLFGVAVELPSEKDRLLLAYRALEVALEASKKMHARRLGHGDLKPENLFWNGEGELVVGDFDDTFTVDKKHRAFTGYWRGTPGYVSPEMFRLEFGDDSLKADVFSLGLTALHLFSPIPFACYMDAETQPREGAAETSVRHQTKLRLQTVEACVQWHEGGRISLEKSRAQFGSKWDGLTAAMAELTLADAALSRLVISGMLQSDAAKRKSAAEALAAVRALIETSDALVGNGATKDAEGGAPNAASRRATYERRCRELFSAMSLRSSDARLARADLFRLSHYPVVRVCPQKGDTSWWGAGSTSREWWDTRVKLPWPRLTTHSLSLPTLPLRFLLPISAGWWPWMRQSVDSTWRLAVARWAPWLEPSEPRRLAS